jgi:hypothetical protein
LPLEAGSILGAGIFAEVEGHGWQSKYCRFAGKFTNALARSFDFDEYAFAQDGNPALQCCPKQRCTKGMAATLNVFTGLGRRGARRRG